MTRHLLIALALLGGAPALAKPPAKPPPAAAPAAPAEAPAALVEGRALFERGDWAEAVAALSEVPGGPGDAFWTEARGLMGRSLDALGLGQLALLHYADVLRAGTEAPGFELAYNASAALSRFLQDDRLFGEVVSGLGQASLPALERSQGLYSAGLYLADAERYKEAVAFLTAIPRGDALFSKARLQMARVLIRLEERPLALAILTDVLDNDPAGVASITHGESLLHLDIARMAYGMGLYDQAVDQYARVRRASPWWTDALLEQAWANYALWQGQGSERALSQSLGALTALTSPALAGLYYPEAWLLQAQILFQLCKGASGSQVVDAFLARFEPLLPALSQALAAEGGDLAALYQTVVDFRAGRPVGSALPAPFLSMFLSDPGFDRLEVHLGRITREHTLVQTQRRAWEGPVEAQLLGLLDTHGQAIRQAEGARILNRLTQEEALLKETLVATQLAQLDLLTQQANMYEAAAGGRALAPRVTKRRWQLPDDRRAWPFEGEYWQDELGYYQVSTTSECLNIQE